MILDAGWYGLETDPRSNPMTSRDYLLVQADPHNPRLTRKEPPHDWRDPIDVPGLVKYAKARNVGIVLYVNDIARHHFDLQKTLETFRKWGVAGIKYGFMKGGGQQKVLATRKIVALCASNHLICDFHDSPIPPSGDRRTYPNYLVREFCHGQADATRSFSPATFCTTVFCNMLAGPLDMCNGFFTLDGVEKVRPKVFAPINSTVVAEAARVLIVFSGLAILPDTPESYAAKQDLFQFVAKLPMTWDDTIIVNASVGHYITTARRSGDQWFVGSCCDEQGAELRIALKFLNPNVTYAATLYEDGPNAHFMQNKETYQIRRQTVSKNDVLTAQLAPGGGHCIYLRPVGHE